MAVTMYDYKQKLGGMAHIMLSDSVGAVLDGERGKYADTAIDLLLDRMLGRGAERGRLVAKLAGGAKMFSHQRERSASDIGRRNVAAARKELKRLGVVLAGEDVGGGFGRTVELSVQTGKVAVRSMNRRTRTL